MTTQTIEPVEIKLLQRNAELPDAAQVLTRFVEFYQSSLQREQDMLIKQETASDLLAAEDALDDVADLASLAAAAEEVGLVPGADDAELADVGMGDLGGDGGGAAEDPDFGSMFGDDSDSAVSDEPDLAAAAAAGDGLEDELFGQIETDAPLGGDEPFFGDLGAEAPAAELEGLGEGFGDFGGEAADEAGAEAEMGFADDFAFGAPDESGPSADDVGADLGLFGGADAVESGETAGADDVDLPLGDEAPAFDAFDEPTPAPGAATEVAAFDAIDEPTDSPAAADESAADESAADEPAAFDAFDEPTPAPGAADEAAAFDAFDEPTPVPAVEGADDEDDADFGFGGADFDPEATPSPVVDQSALVDELGPAKKSKKSKKKKKKR